MVAKLLSFCNWLVFVGISAVVAKLLSFVNSLVFVGTAIVTSPVCPFTLVTPAT